MFEKFTQVDASTTRHYGGTSLGLAISRQLATLWAERSGWRAKPGNGSEFWFTARFPVQADGAPAAVSPVADLDGVRVLIVDDNRTNREILTNRLTAWGMRTAEAEDGNTGIEALRRGRILLAEDNITSQLVALGILRRFGLPADAVANGIEAVAAIAAIPYDLVLMDVMMPEMDGLEATRRIRSHEADREREPGAPPPRIPIVAMTANATVGDREQCLDAGMDDYVTKPVSPTILAAVLERWLPASEDVLVGLAQLLGQGVRPYDAVGRMGGEAFLVVAPMEAAADRALNQAKAEGRNRVAADNSFPAQPVPERSGEERT